jgi:hypothetical protein
MDRKRGFVVSPEGIVVIGKEDAVDPLSLPVQV